MCLIRKRLIFNFKHLLALEISNIELFLVAVVDVENFIYVLFLGVDEFDKEFC